MINASIVPYLIGYAKIKAVEIFRITVKIMFSFNSQSIFNVLLTPLVYAKKIRLFDQRLKCERMYLVGNQ